MLKSDDDNFRAQRLRRVIEQRRQKVDSEQSTVLTERNWNTGDFTGKCQQPSLVLRDDVSFLTIRDI